MRIIETSIVNTHSPFPVLLFYKNKIGQPLRMIYFLDKSSHQKLRNLLINDSVLLLIEAM
jgi:hypothetical protein